jgi:hypothetical protein
LKRDERIVDDEDARLVTDAAHDAANDRRIFRTIDAGDAETDGGRNSGVRRHRLVHDCVENLLELQFADRLQVGAGPFGGRQHATVLVTEDTDGLRAADVDAEDVHGVDCSVAARPTFSRPW